MITVISPTLVDRVHVSLKKFYQIGASFVIAKTDFCKNLRIFYKAIASRYSPQTFLNRCEISPTVA